MYIVSLTYHRPIAEVDSHLDGHIARLKTYFQDGTFIASGRKNPRTGGVIWPRALTVRGWTPSAEDPFNAVAHYEVTDFSATTAAAGFEALAGL